MTTREKIIVGVMCLTVVYGAYELLSTRKHKNKPQQTTIGDPMGELKTFVAEVTQKLVNEKVAREYQYIIAQAGVKWPKDPFIQSIGPLKESLATTIKNEQPIRPVKLPEIVYTGFMQIGDTKLAIINGMEYAVGESLASKQYYVKSISAQHVMVGKVGSPDTIQIPIREFD